MTIEEVIENFDFVKVHKVMESLNWTWVTKKKKEKIIFSLKLYSIIYYLLVIYFLKIIKSNKKKERKNT